MKEDNLKKLERVKEKIHLYSPSDKILDELIVDLNNIIESEKTIIERQKKFNSGICPDCGKRLSGKHVMGEGWTFYPCPCMEPKIDKETMKTIKKALSIN